MPSSFSPFDCLVVASQTQSGLLQKEEGEVDLVVVENLELRSGTPDSPMVPLTEQNQVDEHKSNGKWEDRSSGLFAQLTSHRIVFWSNSSGSKRESRYLHLSQILQMTPESHYFKSPKLLLATAALGDLLLVYPKDKAKLRDDCHQLLQKALSRKQWEEAKAAAIKSSANTATSTRRVGVDAILTRNARRHETAARITDSAFSGDAEQLLTEAKELVQVIHKYVATLDRQEADQSDDPDAQKQLVGLLTNMGMTSALSKADFSGNQDAYLDQVSRELADFCRPKFSGTTPVLTLTDVYCYFNRARGSHLLSPEDVLAAAERCQKLQLGLSVSEFPSGLKVLQDDRHADPVKLTERLAKLREKMNVDSLTAMDISQQWKVSAVLAMEQLQMVERLGYLVRDETLETLRFFPNLFDELSSRGSGDEMGGIEVTRDGHIRH